MLAGQRTFVHEMTGPMFQQMSETLYAWFWEQAQDALQVFEGAESR